MFNEPAVNNLPPSPTLPPSSAVASKRIGATVALSLLIALAGFAIPAYVFFWPQYQQSKIIEQGQPAQATIVSIKPTGNVYNDQPQVKLTLRVQPPSGEAFTSETRLILNPVYVPQFQPGKQLNVHFLPDDHSQVAIDEEQP
jgi:hypothetical protein